LPSAIAGTASMEIAIARIRSIEKHFFIAGSSFIGFSVSFF
jgi:hypothetical protein